MPSRRVFLKLFAAAAPVVSRSAFADDDKTLRLGALSAGAPINLESPVGKALIGALNNLGYVSGRNLIIETRGAMANVGKLPALIEELKAAGSQIFLGVGYPAALAAKTAGVPMVIFNGAGDPVASSLIESWAHPGGVITGISDSVAALTVKRLELLKTLSPGLKRVAMLWNTEDRAMTQRSQVSAATAQLQGITVLPLGVREPNDFAGVFTAMDRDRPDAILMVADALTALNRKRVFDYAAEKRLPAIYESDAFVRDGGLMSYGADQKESLARAVSMIDRIFKGERPGDIPFEQPTRYLFAFNMKTARAMGLDPPVNLLALADDVIE
jgi:putative ABC transport system substrate-binding protein